MKRCSTELGMRAFEIGSHINAWNLDSPELTPVYKVASIYECKQDGCMCAPSRSRLILFIFRKA